MAEGNSELWLITTISILGIVAATDPLFKFVPAQSLNPLPVQTETLYTVEMVVGSNAAANTVIQINGPFKNGHAGMTVVESSTTLIGSNVNAQTPIQEARSTSKDGLYDIAAQNFSSVSRKVPATETVADNTLKLSFKMVTVDIPDVPTSEKLWVWASAEVGDEYVWVSEELTTIKRDATDAADLEFKVDAPMEPGSTIMSGDMMQINGTVKHTAASRLNAYNAVLRFYFPPYAEYIQNSFEKVNEKFSTAEVTHYKINSRNELQVKYTKIGITDKPDFKFKVRLWSSNLHLRPNEHYKADIPVLMSYCEKSDCSPSGVKQGASKNITIKKNLYRRGDAKAMFHVKHFSSGRCLSYQNGIVLLKAACDDLFTYNANGRLQHVSSGSCAYIDSNQLKMATNQCENGTILYLTKSHYLRMFYYLHNCLQPSGSGLENDVIVQSTSCQHSAKFTFKRAVPATARIIMGSRAVLHQPNTAEFFFCNKEGTQLVPSCYFKNGTYLTGVKALPVVMGQVKAFDPATKELYGIHYSGKCYIIINMQKNLEDVYQLDDKLWDTVKAKSGMVLSTDINAASLQNYPVKLNDQFAVSLKGIYQMHNSAWKMVSRW